MFRESGGDELIGLLSCLAGYDISNVTPTYHLAINRGDNPTSVFHSDTWCSTVKGFIYLSDVTEATSPFQYLEGSYADIGFRSCAVFTPLSHDKNLESGVCLDRESATESAWVDSICFLNRSLRNSNIGKYSRLPPKRAASERKA